MMLEIDSVTISFGSDVILEDINLKILKNTRYGLIGANGAGKSTLLRIINKELHPDTGSLHYSKNIKIGFLKQDSGLNHNNIIYDEMVSVFSELILVEERLKKILAELEFINSNSEEFKEISDEYTRLQNYFEVSGGYQINIKINKILNGMGFSEERFSAEIKTLSGGEKTRLAMAKILLEEPNLLILDEPTNHLDFKTLNWLENYLSEYKHSILVVSHDRYFLDKITNSILDLSNKKIKTYNGNYSRYLKLKKEYDDWYLKEYTAQQEEILKLEDYIARNIARASTSNMAKSRRKTLEKMEILPKPERVNNQIHLNFKTSRKSYYDLLNVKDLEIAVGDNNEINLCKNINLEVKRDEKIAIVGANGVGKSTLIKIIQNLHPYKTGEITWGDGVHIGYFEQETRDLDPKKTVIDELWDRYKHVPEVEIRRTLGSVGITGEEVFKEVSVLSGGEKAKVKFCILSLKPSNVLIMDEPTNHLDLESKDTLEIALEKYTGSIIFISHDRYILNKIPDKIVEITPTGALIYDGKYDDYMAIKEKEIIHLKEATSETEMKTTKAPTYTTREDRRVEAKRRIRVNYLETRIATLEEFDKSLLLEISKEDVYSDYQLMGELTEKIEKNKGKIEKYFSEWTSLQEK